MNERPGLDSFVEFCGGLKVENGDFMEVHEFEHTMLADYFAGCRETLVLVSKKNGKSTLLAAVALHRLISLEQANVAIVASSRDQAMILFEQARGFCQRTPWLAAQVQVLRGYREIRKGNKDDIRGIVKVYAADADTADGWLGDLALVDELHRHKSDALYGVLRDGLGPRDGQMITISTAGETEDSPLGLLRAKAYACDGMLHDGAYHYVREGGFAMHEWSLEATDDLDDIELVKTANPAPWQTVEELRNRHDSPSMTPWQWARFACGVWGMGSAPAFDKDVWAELEDPSKSIPEDALVTLGFDGARRRDTTALVATEVETGHLEVVGFWPRPLDADDDWEAPEREVDEAVAYAFERWEVWRLYADPPFWESAVDRWAGEYGREKVVSWWTNRVKTTALALRAFRHGMRDGEMSHDGNVDLAEHVRNAIRVDTNMVDNDELLWVIAKASRASTRKIDLAMAAMLSWEARGDAIAADAKPESSTVTVVV